jgi:Icc-related predicted phosphoesterase
MQKTEEGPFKVLLLSDVIVSFIYSPQVRHRFPDTNLLIGCGDLAYYYIEYVLNALDIPCFFVRGNHDKIVEYSLEAQRTAPAGAVDIHRKVINHNGWLLAGVEGSLWYRPGPFQYTQSQMWQHVFRLVPAMLINRLRYGRFLDIFITHAPPAGIHDMPDLPHQGIKAFRWLLEVFQPSYHFHGHIHVYRPDAVVETKFDHTQVINAFSYREVIINQALPKLDKE